MKKIIYAILFIVTALSIFIILRPLCEDYLRTNKYNDDKDYIRYVYDTALNNSSMFDICSVEEKDDSLVIDVSDTLNNYIVHIETDRYGDIIDEETYSLNLKENNSIINLSIIISLFFGLIAATLFIGIISCVLVFFEDDEDYIYDYALSKSKV